MKAVLYTRVSTKDQTPENQLQDLRRYAAARGFEVLGEYVDVGVSGRKERRPGLDEVMALARSRQVDIVLVAAFDRFARSSKHLVMALEEFTHLGVGFISLREQLDLTSPMGKAMYVIIAAMAQLEVELVRERVKAGIRRAREQGTRSGRPVGRPRRVFHRDRVAVLRAQGQSLRAIARTLEISPRTVARILQERPA